MTINHEDLIAEAREHFPALFRAPGARDLLDRMADALAASDARLREAEAVIAEIGSLDPMWPRGMYGCPQDMFGRNQIRAILSRYKPTNQEET